MKMKLKTLDLREMKLFPAEAFVFPEEFIKDVKGVLIPQGLIAMREEKLAQEIYYRFRDKNPVIVPLLDGASEFFHGLFRDRQYTFARSVVFLTAKSYSGKSSTGEIRFPNPAQWELVKSELDGNSRPILIVEDIIDSGRTISLLKKKLIGSGIAEERISIASLLSKPAKRLPEHSDLWIDHLGFVIPDEFIVGHGLDYDEKYRELPDICVLKEEVLSER